MEYNILGLPDDEDDTFPVIVWLNHHGFLHIEDRNCEICDNGMEIRLYEQVGDVYCMTCTHPQCKTREPILRESIFENSNLSLRTQILTLLQFAAKTSQEATARWLGISKQTVSKILVVSAKFTMR